MKSTMVFTCQTNANSPLAILTISIILSKCFLHMINCKFCNGLHLVEITVTCIWIPISIL